VPRSPTPPTVACAWRPTGAGSPNANASTAPSRQRSSPTGSPEPAPSVLMVVTYDTGALIAADRNDRIMWALQAGFLAEEVTPTVPSPVLAEAWRGRGRQANLSRFLALCDVEDLTFDKAKAVGVLAGRAGT
jgi:hypothetical protein